MIQHQGINRLGHEEKLPVINPTNAKIQKATQPGMSYDFFGDSPILNIPWYSCPSVRYLVENRAHDAVEDDAYSSPLRYMLATYVYLIKYHLLA